VKKLRERLLSGTLVVIGSITLVVIGGIVMTAGLLIVFGIASMEWVHLVARRGHRAFGGLMILWVALFLSDRTFPWLELLWPGGTFLLIVTLGWAIVRFRQGTANAMTGFALTIAGGLYIGWAGAHFISIRALPEGLYWTLVVLMAVWFSDTVAYLVGSAIGKNKLVPDISPGKTWEGYLGGIVGTPILTALAALLLQQAGASQAISLQHGFWIGALIATVGPLGDIGMSMFKRYAGAKDSSNLIPGHGGVLDRIDSLLISGMLAYYYLTLFARSPLGL
jgi:phosphatidate cytidylyltransferase